MIQSLIDHVWQSSLVALCAALLTLAFRKDAATIRFRIWLAASVKFLVPFPLVLLIGQSFHWEHTPVFQPSAELSFMMDDIVEPGSAMISTVMAPTLPRSPQSWPVWSIVEEIWVLGFAVLLCRWMLEWAKYRRIVKDSFPYALEAPIPVRTTPTTLEPGIFGIIRPVLLLPEGVADHLSPEQMDTILAHELCHWRRKDNLSAAFHMLVEALFWFNPLVWWIGTRMVVERERACDEAVLQAGHAPEDYAEGILRVCRTYLESSLPCVTGVSGGTLKQRIESIMMAKIPARLRRAKKILLGVTAGLAVVILAACALSEGPNAPAGSALDGYVGYYRVWNIVYGVTRDGNTLRISASGQPDPETPSQISSPDGTTFFNPGRSSLVTFKTDGRGKVTHLLFHSASGRLRVMRRITEEEATSFPAYFASRVRENKPDPQSETVLRRFYEASAQAGKPDLSYAADNFANTLTEDASYRTSPAINHTAGRGSLQSLTFLGVDSNGFDTYHAVFSNADLYLATVLTPSGKIDGVWPSQANSKTPEKASFDEKTLDGYVGKYQLHSLNIITISQENGRTFYLLNGNYPVSSTVGIGHPVEIVADGNGTFHYAEGQGRGVFTTDASGRTSLRVFVGSRYGFGARKLSQEQAVEAEAYLAKRRSDNLPLPGSEAVLRQHIEDRRSGRFSDDSLDPEVATPLRNISSSQRPIFAALGTLQSLTFNDVAENGWDHYTAHFDNGDLAFYVMVTPDNVLRGIFYSAGAVP